MSTRTLFLLSISWRSLLMSGICCAAGGVGGGGSAGGTGGCARADEATSSAKRIQLDVAHRAPRDTLNILRPPGVGQCRQTHDVAEQEDPSRDDDARRKAPAR